MAGFDCIDLLWGTPLLHVSPPTPILLANIHSPCRIDTYHNAVTCWNCELSAPQAARQSLLQCKRQHYVIACMLTHHSAYCVVTAEGLLKVPKWLYRCLSAPTVSSDGVCLMWSVPTTKPR
eukprot:GHRR01017629.1.p2 GENE.GHRR01017629.1~~GHRR01017629.1.p2  ORF type:complete len:121 (-),score=9.33 GHRR01017629.1:1477-1839(-)